MAMVETLLKHSPSSRTPVDRKQLRPVWIDNGTSVDSNGRDFAWTFPSCLTPLILWISISLQCLSTYNLLKSRSEKQRIKQVWESEKWIRTRDEGWNKNKKARDEEEISLKEWKLSWRGYKRWISEGAQQRNLIFLRPIGKSYIRFEYGVLLDF